ncbi:MAG: L-arabinose ABC transporter permease AraH [Spirochaetales bacterium]|nr:L-arabinose ABC transporter permease AraH [Spirochaetales bacterium]
MSGSKNMMMGMKINNKFLKSLWESSGMIIIYLGLFIVLSVFVPYFFTVRNMIGLALSVSMVGMVAMTMLFALASGDFDLSVEAIVAFAGVTAAMVINATGSILIGIIAGIIGGAVIGFLNGIIIAKAKINALITTLAMMQIVHGLAFIVSGGSAVGISDSRFFVLGNSRILGIPNPIWITILMFIIFGILLNRTTYGKNTLAIGGNIEAARLAGINVDRIKIIIFTLQGAMAGFAGVVLASRMTSGQPNTSVGFSLDVISACVLGGVSLSGGIAPIAGAIVGVLIMGTIQNAMNLMNIPAFYQYVVRGLILLIAVLIDQLKQTRRS